MSAADFDALIMGAAPVGYWKLNEASGTTLSDSSGNGLHATLRSLGSVNGAPVLFGEPSLAIVAGTGAAADAPNSSLLSLPGDFTLGMIVNLSVGGTLFTKEMPGVRYPTYVFTTGNGLLNTYVYPSNAATNQSVAGAGGVSYAGAVLAVTRRTGNTVESFYNGTRVAVGAITYTPWVSTDSLGIGGPPNNSFAGGGTVGRISRAFVFNKSLSDATIAALVSATGLAGIKGRVASSPSARVMATSKLYSGARPISASSTCADGSPGPGSIVGTVKVDTLSVSRKVRLFDVASGRLLKETWSDKSGIYRFDGLALDRPYTVLSHDHLRDYNATVADYVYAEVLP